MNIYIYIYIHVCSVISNAKPYKCVEKKES